MADRCFECDSTESIHYHHVVPKTLGGKKTIPLCNLCHGLVHNIDYVKIKSLQMAGIEKAKKDGKYKGRTKASIKKVESAINLIKSGQSVKSAASKYNIGLSTLYRYLNDR